MDALRFKIGHAGDHGGGNRAGDNGKLRGNHRHGKWAFGADAVAAAHFGNHGQHGIGDVPRACQNGKHIGYGRRDKGDVFRVAAQHAGGDFNHVVQTARGLHGGGGGHHRHNHQHHVNRGAGGLQAESEHQHRQPQAAEHAQTDAADLRTD